MNFIIKFLIKLFNLITNFQPQALSIGHIFVTAHSNQPYVMVNIGCKTTYQSLVMCRMSIPVIVSGRTLYIPR